MSSRSAGLGRCPACGASIPRRCALIEYETADGRATYAECPGCRDVVHPVPEHGRSDDSRGTVG